MTEGTQQTTGGEPQEESRGEPMFVGYLDGMPRRTRTAMRGVVLGVFVAVAASAAALTSAQLPFDASGYDLIAVRTFEGVVRVDPHPTIELDIPAAAGEGVRAFVVNLGKFSARGALEVADGKRARLRGKLVYRGDQVMIELLPWSVEVLGEEEVLGEGEAAGEAAKDHAGEAVEALGEVTLVGEIVDSKCYYGVMNPGNLKPHRGCAVRCISGGIPPVLVVRSEAGGATSVRYVLLVGPDGAPINDAILDRVAEPVQARGALERHDDMWVLRVDPSEITRIPSG